MVMRLSLFHIHKHQEAKLIVCTENCHGEQLLRQNAKFGMFSNFMPVY